VGVKEVTYVRHIRSVRVGSACSGDGLGERPCVFDVTDSGKVQAVNVLLGGRAED
jgi:hypothetical protein